MNGFTLINALDGRQWLFLSICALLIGLSKAGVKGMGLLAVPILAAAFGGKVSSGIMLPMLTIADCFAVWYYNRHANWKYIIQLIPATLVGILIGVWIGAMVDDELFKLLMGVIIVVGLLLMFLLEWKPLPKSLIDSWGFASIFGLLGGFSTMIGNAAGPVMAVYLLSTRIPKNSFIGTGAWFFFVINILKWPFHIFVWKTITLPSFILNLVSLPLIALGVWIGILIVKRIPEKEFRYFIMFMTLIIAIKLMIG